MANVVQPLVSTAPTAGLLGHTGVAVIDGSDGGNVENHRLNNECLSCEFLAVQEYSMLQMWPVRAPRPVAQKLLADTPLLTGRADGLLSPALCLGLASPRTGYCTSCTCSSLPSHQCKPRGLTALRARPFVWCRRPARAGRPLPCRVGWYVRDPRRVWLWQDRDLAGPLQVLQLRRHHLREHSLAA